MVIERRTEKRWFVENIPQELKDLPNWIGFKFIPQKDKKDRKEPVNVRTGGKAMSNKPGTWASFHEVIKRAERPGGDAIGIGLQEPYVGIDLDHSVIDGVIQPWARRIIEAFNSYTEFSPSKTGLHILCKGVLEKGRKFSALDIEIYQKTRFWTVTGDLVPGCGVTIENRASQVLALCDECERKEAGIKHRQDIVEKIEKSKDAGVFAKLKAGNWQGDYPSQSEADLAFCAKLAFWTGKDAALMDEMFRASGLMRPKWYEKHFSDGRTYGQAVIDKAISGCQEAYGEGRASGPAGKIGRAHV